MHIPPAPEATVGRHLWPAADSPIVVVTNMQYHPL